MSFHKKNIHSLPKKRFFWFEPPSSSPPPQTLRKFQLIFILSLQFGLQAPHPLQISSEPLEVPGMDLFLEIYQAGINCSFWSLNAS